MESNAPQAGTGLLDELVEICTRMSRDKERLTEICRLIAPAEAPGDEGPRKRRSPAGRRPGRKPRASDESVAAPQRVKPEPWRKVLCSRCGTKTGAIRKGPGVGELYPARHRDGAGNPCPGVDQPAKLPQE